MRIVVSIGHHNIKVISPRICEGRFKYIYFILTIFPRQENTPKTTMSTITIIAPTGAEYRIERMIPIAEALTEIIAEAITTCLKVLKTLMAESAGKIMRAAIRREPTRRIASTITTAVIVAIRRLYSSVFTPIPRVNVSSNVTANILL